jgi:hypothetical protein
MRPRVLWSTTAAVCLAIAAVAWADRMRVQINDAPVREKKSAFSKVVARLGLGDEIEAAAEKDEKSGAVWYAVKQGPGGPLSGYLTAAAVVPADKAKATGKALSRGADDPEIQNATRGWDDVHKSSGGSRNYRSVDWVERVSRPRADPASAEASEFRRAGKIGEFGPRGGDR